MSVSGILDIVNSIAVFQLAFFIVFLFFKGNKIPSTFFLKLHLLCQLVSFNNYLFYVHHYQFTIPLLLFSFPATFMWAPTLLLYIQSRLFVRKFPFRVIFAHSIPALTILIIIIPCLIYSTRGVDKIRSLGMITYFLLKIQLLIYIFCCLYLIYKYLREIKQFTSANEKQKLNWLLFFTYGIAFTSIGDFVINLFPEIRFIGLGYLLFFVFINVFFFKAIIQPDHFLGIDEKKLLAVTLVGDKGFELFRKIEATVNSRQLYLDPELSLNQVARTAGIQDRLVSQAIRQNVNVNFTDYINLKRIQFAKDLLRNTSSAGKKVLEILYDSGFNSKSVFNSQFKKHTGLSPTEFRKQKDA